MTPEWLYKHATLTKPFIVYPKYLDILPGSSYGRALQAELIAPNTLSATDDIAVTMTIAMNTVFADSNDHDPIFGISDGTSFIGFITFDKDNYGSTLPCYKYEGDIINEILQNQLSDSTGTKVNSLLYSSEITIQIKPNEKWGSCHTEHDEGNVFIGNYERKLDLTKGLYLEMLRSGSNERYYIEYIVVNIQLN